MPAVVQNRIPEVAIEAFEVRDLYKLLLEVYRGVHIAVGFRPGAFYTDLYEVEVQLSQPRLAGLPKTASTTRLAPTTQAPTVEQAIYSALWGAIKTCEDWAGQALVNWTE